MYPKGSECVVIPKCIYAYMHWCQQSETFQIIAHNPSIDWCYSKMLITHKQTLISTTLNKIIFGFCVGMHYQWQSTNQFKKKNWFCDN